MEFKTDTLWDVVIIGTGMGGATIGHALARAGHKVLFLEKGADANDPTAFTKAYAEKFFKAPYRRSFEALARAGRSTDMMFSSTGGVIESLFTPFIGSGTGGSTALYGAILERLSPDEMPESDWPKPARDLERWYQAAEQLYRAPNARTHDDLPPAEQEIFDHFNKTTSTPYILPLSITEPKTCVGCQGHLCNTTCRRQANNICLDQAIHDYNATLISHCTVHQLYESKGQIVGAECQMKDGTHHHIRGKIFILAAGALHSPILLLKSANASFPHGLANRSGVVGRYLMRHLFVIYLIKTKAKPILKRLHKGIAVNIQTEAGVFNFQSLEKFPPVSTALYDMFQKLEYWMGTFAASTVIKIARPFIHLFYKMKVNRSLIFAATMSDEARFENKITLESDHRSNALYDTRIPCIEYTVSENDQQKIKIHTKFLDKILSPYSFLKMDQSHDNQRIAHVCGTCRMGDDPTTSVVDAYNKCHDLDNLYIVDGSYLPTSGYHPPSLTIAANALRIADHIHQNWKD